MAGGAGKVHFAMTSYATLQGCRAQLVVDNVTTGDDAYLASLIEVASVRIDRYCGQEFNERYAQHAFMTQLGTRSLHLYPSGKPLLAVTALLNGDDTTIASTDYTLLPRFAYPKTELELSSDVYWNLPSAGVVVYEDPDCIHVRRDAYWIGEQIRPAYGGYGKSSYVPDNAKITGRWGYHSDYGQAWQDSGLTVGTGGITTTATSLPLSTAAGSALDVGNVVRLISGADTEYLLIRGPIAATTAATTLTVRRGYLGSTAVAHASGVTIDRWQPEYPVEEACEKLVTALYASRNNPGGDRLVIEGLGAVQVPSKIPVKVADLLESYVNPFTGRR